MPRACNITATPNASVSITVCVPVYNVEDYLSECLDSICSQSYPHFNVVLVDDGSGDGSGAICDEYALRYPGRVVAVHKDNEGPLLARRDAFARATGDYVMCVDSDDKLFPGALQAIACAAEQTDADVVGFNLTCMDKPDVSLDGSLPAEYYAPDEKPAKLRAICCSTSGSENSMCAKAVRRSCVGPDVDFSPFRGLKFAEDFLQTVIVYDHAETFCTLDAALYYYRPGSGITGEYKPHFYQDIRRCMDIAEGYASRWERDCSCDCLMAGLAACRLDSAARYAEWMASRGDWEGLRALRSSGDFTRCIETSGISKYLRYDRRFVLRAVKRGLFPLLLVVVGARSIMAKAKR